jgi:hypothetical protein
MIDWEHLAVEVGSIRADGSIRGGSDLAQQALERILGEGTIRAAVELAVSFAPAGELAANVLRHVCSRHAAEMAYAIYKTRPHAEAPGAVWLIKEIGHPRALAWIEEFLADGRVAGAGADVLDQLLFTRAVEPTDERVLRLLQAMERQPSETVRVKAAAMRRDAARRQQQLVADLVRRHRQWRRDWRREGRQRLNRRVARLADRLEAEAPGCAVEVARLSPVLAMQLADELRRREQERAERRS